MNQKLEVAAALAKKMLEQEGQKPDDFNHMKAHIGESSNSIMFTGLVWGGGNGDDQKIVAAASLLACCRYVRQHSNEVSDVFIVAHHIGRLVLALSLCDSPSLSIKEKDEILKVAHSGMSSKGGKALHPENTPFKADYRESRDSAPEQSRASIIASLSTTYQDYKAVPSISLERWAKEADNEDTFTRKAGRKPKQ